MGDLLGHVDTALGIGGALLGILAWVLVRLRRLRRGRPQQRYTRFFLQRYGTYSNPYLNLAEPLPLDRTYIELSFADPADSGYDRIATSTMADRTTGNLIVVGDAGSGKTTMLKAYGVSVLRGLPGAAADRVRSAQREVPFFVSVRLLPPALSGGSLADYLRSQILAARAGFTTEEAHAFLRQVLEQRRCVILLDGLDEVSRDDYATVRDEIHRFAADHTADLPTANARLVITCRHHSFLRLRDDWIGAGHSRPAHVYALAPLRDVEIVAFLDRLRDRFKRPDGPQYFLAAIRASGTLRLHRAPLVLSMSVGLYAPREVFDIPRSIADLYDMMIKEMLDRHDFRHEEDRGGGANAFLRDDKLRLLREFSLQRARHRTGFGPFERADLVSSAQQLQPVLRNVPVDRVENFIDEIIERSGLLSPVSGQRYEFAHRSIQEHLVAAELLRRGPQGAAQLRRHATNRDWRQVVVFFTATAPQEAASSLLRALAVDDPVLAGGCLAGADCFDADADAILDRLAAMLRDHAREAFLPALAALLSATTSPRPKIQIRAQELITGALGGITDQSNAVSALGGNAEGVLGIITMLVDRVDQAPISRTLLLRLAAIVPDDPRLVAPLWRWLAQESVHRPIATDPAAEHLGQLVERLLLLACDPACFDELQRQPQQPSFGGPQLRRQVYPFRSALDPASNLVTLLCWAEELGVQPARPNRFLQAKQADRAAWARIEADRPRTGLVMTLADSGTRQRRAGLLFAGAAAVAVVVTVIDMFRASSVLSPSAQAAVLVLAAAELTLALALIGLRGGRGPRVGWRANPFLDVYQDPRSRHWLAPGPDPTPGSVDGAPADRSAGGQVRRQARR